MFNDRLKQARISSGHTQESLAAAIGVKKSTICGYEKGTSEPDMEKISKIMDVLSVDANFLLQDEMKEETGPTYSIAALRVADVYDTLTEAGQQLIDQTIDFASKHHSNLAK